jgi:hypothetical protein
MIEVVLRVLAIAAIALAGGVFGRIAYELMCKVWDRFFAVRTHIETVNIHIHGAQDPTVVAAHVADALAKVSN